MEERQSQAASEEEFYEKIEAPKFVDFTKPDLPRPDDRYWFCLRVGCDQKHEEEMDHEAIYKDFVLRVMAARSPNVRLRKMLNRKAPSTTMKCPLSAPAKPSKSRLSRLAVISSFSQKITEAKVKGSTPKPEVKQSSVVVKALTTPRNKKYPQNRNSFRSVRNPKATTIAVPKNRVVAKALVFHSPKKPRQKKTSLELHTPVSKICQGMKQLEITSQRKRVLGYSVKSSRDIERDPNKQLPSDTSRRKFGTRKVKSRVYDSLRLQNCKGREDKSSRCPKSKSKVEDLQKCKGSLPHEGVENDSSDMEIDEKPRDNSIDGSSLSCTSKSYENGHEKEPSQIAHSDVALSDTSKGDMNSNSEENNFSEFQTLSEEGTKSSGGSDVDVKTESSSLSDSEDRVSEQKNMRQFQTQTGEGNESSGGSEHEEKKKSSSRKRRFLEDHPPKNQISEEAGHHNEDKESNDNENALTSDSEEAGHNNEVKEESDEKENVSASNDKENNSEAMENDDKENVSASDDNSHHRKLKSNKDHCERKLLGRHGVGGTMKKVTQLLDRTCKESFNPAAAGTQSVKCKPKPTNPKPFRLRTDERGILKEAKLERRLHGLAPLKEITAVSRFPSVNSQRRNGVDIQRNEKCPGQEARCRSNTHDKGSEKEPEKITQNQPTKTACKNSKGKVEPRIDTVTPQRQTVFKCPEPYLMTPPLKSDKEDAPQSSSRKTKSSLLQKKLVRPQGIASSSLMKTVQLGVIKETSSTISAPKEARKPWERSVISATKAPSATRSSSRGRRPTTIPKEPNFHSIHTPKSCTRKLA
ncbi:uncharacterized protein LOC104878836 isoform X1 [Vitis vinifera]|uniref:uncharacterized protein LOC104878836 isoform X1 n=1 Tax=Vitis vinifera TaxID=29760 RepID=UPI00053FAC51|nr:uncharacterized protein LOC104878836 isoform X1 [Vitis vinifera]|eukprot:XP_010647983.1 PREDICTED: uncharacterized protein LOC104878836 isoform X3 [Vitis vinifera]